MGGCVRPCEKHCSIKAGSGGRGQNCVRRRRVRCPRSEVPPAKARAGTSQSNGPAKTRFQEMASSSPGWAGEWGNLRLSSLILAFVRLSSLNGRKLFEAPRLISGVSCFGPVRLGSQRRPRSIQLRAWIADEMGRNEPPAGSTSDEPLLSFDDEEKNGN